MNGWEKIKEVFALAAEQPKANRGKFLSELCGDDVEVLREVESLLASVDEPEHLIERENYGAATLLKSKAANYAGKKFGNYRILQEIGHGGMGAVFLAERSDGAFEQKVALKIIRQTFPDDELERHFLRERQILAALNHPNIAKLLDGGVSDAGELFLAMEYVDGKTLVEYADANDLSVEEKLQLFLKICRAVSDAHQNLIVHRDIKPSNIIVDQKGEPKLLDFGLAKIIESAELTNENQTQTIFRAFTPAYAAPEQIRGKKITTAADVYSLGVILYELLTGKKPFQFEGKSLDEILETLNFKEPVKPSAIQNSKFKIQDSKSEDRRPKTENQKPKPINHDLDVIILKSLEKEPARRYKSVEALADDIERHLKHLPIAARPNTLSYRASRFFKRNKISVIAVSFVILALASGLAIALWQAKIARAERIRAERRFADVRQLSNSLLSEIAPKIENLNGSTEAREILVNRALEYLDNLAAESQNDLQLKSELAVAYEKIGDLQGNPQKPNLSDFSGAVASLEKANQIRRELSDTPENQFLLAKNLARLSEAHYLQSDVKGAFENSAESLQIFQTLSANDNSAAVQNAAVEARIADAQMFADSNQYKTAVPRFVKILETLQNFDQNRPETKYYTARTLTFLANALSWDGSQTEAETRLKKALEIVEPLAAQNPNDATIQQQIWRAYIIGSSIYDDTNDQISLAFAGQAVNAAARAVAFDPANTQAKQNLAKAYSRQGISFVQVNKISEAFESLENAKKILTELIEKEPKNRGYLSDFGRFYIRFGDLQSKQNDFAAALDAYQKSTDYFEKIADADARNTLARRDFAQSLKNVGDAQMKLNKLAEAKESYRQTLQILDLLKSENALGEFDGKLYTDVQNALQKL